MKNLKLKSLLAAAVLVCQNAFAAANNEQSRTYFMFSNVADLTSHNNNFSRLKGMETDEDRTGLTVHGSAFYQDTLKTRSREQLAKGLASGATNTVTFSGDNTSNVNLQRVFIPVGLNPATANYAAADKAVVTLSEVLHRRAGGTVGLCYDASRFYEGLWMGANVTVAYERNKITLGVTSEGPHATLPDQKDVLVTLLAGNTLPTGAGNLQAMPALTNLKIESGKALSRTLVNDVHLKVGLNIVNNETASVDMAVCGSIPVASERKTDYLMQANPGERQFRLGAMVKALLRLVCEEDYKIDMCAGACADYAFKKSNENYIPQFKEGIWGQYRLGAASNTVGTAFQPLANLLSTSKTEIDGAAEFGAWINLALEKGCFGGSIGYNLFYAAEKTLTHSIPAGLVQANAITAGAAAANATISVSATNTTPVSSSDFVTSEPSKTNHTVNADLNWTFCDWDYPLLVGVTGAYTFVPTESTRRIQPEYWTIGVRAGISF